MTMGERIKSARKRSGHCQLSLALAIGCEQHCISNWERDKSLPRGDFITALCSGIGLTPNELFGWGEQ